MILIAWVGTDHPSYFFFIICEQNMYTRYRLINCTNIFQTRPIHKQTSSRVLGVSLSICLTENLSNYAVSPGINLILLLLLTLLLLPLLLNLIVIATILKMQLPLVCSALLLLLLLPLPCYCFCYCHCYCYCSCNFFISMLLYRHCNCYCYRHCFVTFYYHYYCIVIAIEAAATATITIAIAKPIHHKASLDASYSSGDKVSAGCSLPISLPSEGKQKHSSMITFTFT